MGNEQGYGWQIDNSGSELVWRRAGGEVGLESLLAVYAAIDIGIITLGNQKDWSRFQLVQQIRDTIADANRALLADSSLGISPLPASCVRLSRFLVYRLHF